MPSARLIQNVAQTACPTMVSWPLYGGEMTLSQAFFLRPLPGLAQYRTPIEGLYLCGAATHPGGGMSGLAGKNAADQVKS